MKSSKILTITAVIGTLAALAGLGINIYLRRRELLPFPPLSPSGDPGTLAEANPEAVYSGPPPVAPHIPEPPEVLIGLQPGIPLSKSQPVVKAPVPVDITPPVVTLAPVPVTPQPMVRASVPAAVTTATIENPGIIVKPAVTTTPVISSVKLPTVKTISPVATPSTTTTIKPVKAPISIKAGLQLNASGRKKRYFQDPSDYELEGRFFGTI